MTLDVSVDWTDNSSGWDGRWESLSEDTMVLVRLGDLLKPSLESELRRVSELGHQVWVRYDRHRQHHFFTILLDAERLCDTDDPVAVLMEITECRRREAEEKGYGASKDNVVPDLRWVESKNEIVTAKLDRIIELLGQIQLSLAFPNVSFHFVEEERCTCAEKGKTTAVEPCPIHG